MFNDFFWFHCVIVVVQSNKEFIILMLLNCCTQFNKSNNKSNQLYLQNHLPKRRKVAGFRRCETKTKSGFKILHVNHLLRPLVEAGGHGKGVAALLQRSGERLPVVLQPRRHHGDALGTIVAGLGQPGRHRHHTVHVHTTVLQRGDGGKGSG